MKYIRTKDGRIVNISEYKEKNIYYQDTHSPDYIAFCEIINQADTIEELCDEFVATLPNTKPYIFKEGEYKELDKKPKEWLGTLFGAIWTDKGLIYVAKMNDKGELELL